jgi:hypothetical protein
MTTKEEALKLYDEGIPTMIEDRFLRSMLNGHRWGWHQTAFMMCPACERQAAS